ncbi:fatty acid alpha-hydroxylase [Pichia californica]|uniref:Ceramide very long chain fatty acid hydroxylase n=1 Tax=Pichia californica TaxID=460514 RepID=A0A9P7BH53_9ASCO|nr:fatty acid alpha-hydroxylase [[Candida] californica]KAG0689584.1 fatty acid alpha-hydroxylase [[Candida] californica]
MALPLLSRAAVEKHASKSSCWVTLYNRKVYDVTGFLDEHPAGAELILEYAGKDITKILADAESHVHSESAYEMLEDGMLVGYLATEEEERELLSKHKDMTVIQETSIDSDGMRVADLTEFGEIPDDLLHVRTDHSEDYKKHKFLDLDKPLIMQVLRANWTRDFYIDQIHRPRHYGKGSAQLFGNFLEPLSLTPWWVVPTVWLPVNFYVFYQGITHLNPILAISLWALGLFVWTLIEYCLHRFLFHLDDNLPENNIAFTLHFLLHGVHHYLPMDQMRLVMPPTLFVVLCYPFYRLVFAIFPYYVACAGFSGGFLGYILYDVCHYSLHHKKLPNYIQKLKRYHLEHHYKNYRLGFGVTSMFWDKVFHTYLHSEDVYQKKN